MKMPECQNINVLIIDDEEEFARTLAERLELRGISVSLAFSGEEGLNLLRPDAPGPSPGVLLLDMRLPGLSGLEILKRTRALRPGLPVFILTGHCPEAELQAAARLGIHGLFTKPVPFDDLLEAISRVACSCGKR